MQSQLSEKDHKKITRRILERKANLQHRDGESSVWLIRYKDNLYRVVFDELNSVISTILMLPQVEFARAHEENPFLGLLDIRQNLPHGRRPRQKRGKR